MDGPPFEPSTETPIFESADAVADTADANYEKNFMTKIQFREKLASNFTETKDSLEQDLSLAQLRVKKVQLLKDLLENCIYQAADKV